MKPIGLYSDLGPWLQSRPSGLMAGHRVEFCIVADGVPAL